MYAHHPLPLAHFNAVHRVDLPEADLDAAVAEVIRAHGAARSRWRLRPDQPALERRLAAAGYQGAAAQSMRLRLTEAADLSDPEPLRVRERSEVLSWYRVFCASRGHRPVERDAPWEALLGPASPHHLFLARVDGVPVACGALQVDRIRGVGLLWGGGTVPHAQGQGAWRALVQARLAVARALDLRWAATTALVDTSQPGLAALGFEVCGPRCYDWERG